MSGRQFDCGNVAGMASGKVGNSTDRREVSARFLPPVGPASGASSFAVGAPPISPLYALVVSSGRFDV
jgi:hypothetical protein